MNSDKKLYLYSGLAIALSVVAYVVITKSKKANTDPTTNVKPDVKTTTGDIISNEQSVIDSSLQEILNKSLSEANATLQGKPIFTKLDNVQVRNGNYVNNGIVNNIMSSISNKETLLGNVIAVVEDKGRLTNISGKVFRWLKIQPAQVTLDDMNKNKAFLTRNFLPEYKEVIFVREDVIKL
jgi:F0F1-type ATP synthase delta subunit